MAVPNKKLRALREATPSRTIPGAPMSRSELAELINAYLWEASNRKTRTMLDGHTIGRYERGDVRWPGAAHRAGLRAVLNAATDAELGFWPTRRGRAASLVESATSAVGGNGPNGGLDTIDPGRRANGSDRQFLKADTSGVQANYTEIDLATACDWLDDYAGWPPETSRRKVASRLSMMTTGEMLDQHARRARVTRSQISRALAHYYSDDTQNGGAFRANCGKREIETSVLTRPEWLNLACPLTPGNDTLALDVADHGEDGVASVSTDITYAVNRLAEIAALDARVANVPLYRLLSIDAKQGAVAGSVGMAPFIEYALTMDLLESELIDSIIAAKSTRRGEFSLRDNYLPDIASVLDLSGRLCAGGALALCAIARPSDAYRGAPDYALLVQERSGYVLNATRRLAVIPKGFHQPLTDFRADARIGATLRRELEEELFGRGEVDNTDRESRAAAPMHPSRLSEPMRWLMEEPDRLRMECTGFGLNLVSGNYEFASLIVIEDEDFWTRYGGQVEANWESAGLRVYSSLDCQLIAELISDESWSNEGLFAFLQGLRRLGEIGGKRVNLPLTGWDVGSDSGG